MVLWLASILPIVVRSASWPELCSLAVHWAFHTLPPPAAAVNSALIAGLEYSPLCSSARCGFSAFPCSLTWSAFSHLCSLSCQDWVSWLHSLLARITDQLGTCSTSSWSPQRWQLQNWRLPSRLTPVVIVLCHPNLRKCYTGGERRVDWSKPEGEIWLLLSALCCFFIAVSLQLGKHCLSRYCLSCWISKMKKIPSTWPKEQHLSNLVLLC